MADVFFDPKLAGDLAKFQGTLAGTLAGRATHVGVAMAPTSIYNQAGFYALQDTDTGYIHLEKLHNDSLYTNQWYDQGLGKDFDFSNNEKSVFNESDLHFGMSADEIAALDA